MLSLPRLVHRARVPCSPGPPVWDLVLDTGERWGRWESSDTVAVTHSVQLSCGR